MAQLDIEALQLTPRVAFDAMRTFLSAFWERGGRQSDDLAALLGALEPQADGNPIDAAQWTDWLDAIKRTR